MQFIFQYSKKKARAKSLTHHLLSDIPNVWPTRRYDKALGFCVWFGSSITVWKFWLVTWWISWKIWQHQGHFWVIIEGTFILTRYISLHCSNSARSPGTLWQDSFLSPTQALSGFFFRFKYHTLTHWTTLLRVLFSLTCCVVLCFV